MLEKSRGEMMEQEYKDSIEDLIGLICNGHDDSLKDLPSRILFKTVSKMKRDLENVAEDFRDDFERELEFHTEYISKLMSNLFSERYWYKFEEGHDLCPGHEMVCYF